MQATVFCKTTAKATQSFFVKVGGREYFLFQQDFRKSNKEFFRKIFIYLGQYRDRMSQNLLAKMYQFSMKI